MVKKVCFLTKEDDDRYDIVLTVLTEGYAIGAYDSETTYDGTRITFEVNRCDLKDLRHDASVLVKAGFFVREVALS